jgi:hypothetical protein
MSIYNAKTLFTGYKLGLKSDKVFVGVPRQKLKEDCIVKHDKDTMFIKRGTKPQTRKRFDDKFVIDKKYWLHYFIWKPDIKEPEITQEDYQRSRQVTFQALREGLRQKGLIK